MHTSKLYKSILLISILSMSGNVMAQQLFKLSQYVEHSFLHNPGAVGANGFGTVGGAYRSQWSGIDGGPVTAVLFADKYFASKNTGIGIILYTDKTGPTSRTGGELNLSYSVKLGGDKRLMIGVGGQVIQFKVDKSKIAASIPNDPLLASNGSAIKGDAQAGIYYCSNTFNLGISAKQLIQSKLNFIKTAANPNGRLYRQYFGTASYYIRTDEDNVLLPHVEIRYQPEAPVDYEGGLILYHKDLLHFGFSYHYQQSYTAFLGIKIRHKLSISYAYDFYNKPVSGFETGYGAHEVMLRYFFTR